MLRLRRLHSQTMKASICIPSFNRPGFLKRAIASALAQDFDDFEVVVSDNSLTEGPLDVCRSIQDARFRFARFEERGQTPNVNNVMSLSRGDYLVLLCDDDLLKPSFLRRACKILDEHSGVGMVHSSVEHIDSEGMIKRVQSFHSSDVIERGDQFCKRMLLEGGVLFLGTVLFRRSNFEHIGGFSDQARWFADWNFLIKNTLLGDVAYIAEPLASYRHHDSNLTHEILNAVENGADEVRMLENFFESIPADKAYLRSFKSAALARIAQSTCCNAEEFCRAGDSRRSRAQLMAALRAYPWVLLRPKFIALLAATYCGYSVYRAARSVKPQRPKSSV